MRGDLIDEMKGDRVDEMVNLMSGDMINGPEDGKLIELTGEG